MKKIQMVDLKSQYNKIKKEIDSKVIEVLESSAYINGPAVKSFQKNLEDYLEVKHVIPCGNGTDALMVSLMALDLKPGDEIITSDFTFAATAEVIEILGLKSVLVDINHDDFNINTEAIKKAITNKTKAIIPVHLFGQCAHMEAILQIAKEHHLFVIEDTAQAIGAEYTFSDGTKKKAGTMGDFGTTSFFPSKNLGAFGDGGAVFTHDDQLANKLRGIVNHGMYKRYYHDKVGVNSRLDSLQAAILDIKLKHLDSYNSARQKAAEFYNKAFENHPHIETPVLHENSTHVFHQYTLKIKNADRNALKEFLDSKEIPNAIYYPVPLHRQKAYNNNNYKEDDFITSNELCESVISLPMHSELEIEQLEFITQTVKSFFNE